MHLVVAGASGFIGPNLIEYLARHGHTGVAVSRRTIGLLPTGWTWMSRTECLEPEFSSSTASFSANRFDALIHLEVKQHVPHPTDHDIKEFESVNVQGKARWLKWVDAQEILRVIFFSTIKAVGNSLACQDETTLSAPNTAYGKSKLAAEHSVQNWARANRERSALILRPSVVYGPGTTANLLSFVQAIDARRFVLLGRNENIKSLVSVQNLCAAAEHLMLRMKPGVEIFNLVDARSYTVRELASMIALLLGFELKLLSIPLQLAQSAARIGDVIGKFIHLDFPLTTPRLLALTETTHFSCDKLVGTGFQHPQTTEQGLGEMIEWYRRKFVRR